MRIAHVISSLNPSMGGLPTSAVAQAAAQSHLGHDTTLVFFEGSDSPATIREAYGSFPGFDQIHLSPLKVSGSKKLLPSGLNEVLESFKPDVIHTHGLWEPLLAYTQRYGLKHHIPFVVFPQSMLHPWQARKHRVAKWLLQHGLGWKRRWKKAAFIHVLSDEEATHWKKIGITQTKKIPNGIFPSEDPENPEELSYPWAKKPFILSLARLHPQKSPDVLLEAFAKIASEFPSLGLVLAGPDYGMKDVLEKRIDALNLKDRVFLPGSLFGAEKWSALHACRCFCLPSQAEGFSLALLEAALAGVPLVYSKECYFDALANVGAGVLSKVDVDELSKSLKQVLDQSPRMGEAGKALVLDAYTWDILAARLIDAYQEVLR